MKVSVSRQRIFAFILDAGILYILTMIIMNLALPRVSNEDVYNIILNKNPDFNLSFNSVIYNDYYATKIFVQFVIILFFFIVFPRFNKSQTPGQKLYSIIMVNSINTPISPNQQFIHTLFNRFLLINLVLFICSQFLTTMYYLLFSSILYVIFGIYYVINVIMLLTVQNTIFDYIFGTKISKVIRRKRV